MLSVDFDVELLTQWLDSLSDPAPDETLPRQVVSPEEERRLRRIESNRESARRSRERKQRHIEDLRVLGVRLRAENRGLSVRVAAVVQRSLLVRKENRRLSTESIVLRQRLSELRRHLLLVRCLQRLEVPAPTAPTALSTVPSVVAVGGVLGASCYCEQT